MLTLQILHLSYKIIRVFIGYLNILLIDILHDTYNHHLDCLQGAWGASGEVDRKTFRGKRGERLEIAQLSGDFQKVEIKQLHKNDLLVIIQWSGAFLKRWITGNGIITIRRMSQNVNIRWEWEEFKHITGRAMYFLAFKYTFDQFVCPSGPELSVFSIGFSLFLMLHNS